MKRRQDAYGKFTRTVYEPSTSGLRLYQWGTKAHPTKTVFDAYGQKTELRTYRTGGTMWELDQDDTNGEAVLPSDFSNSAKGDLTTWAYDSWTGLMTAKTDAAAESVTYTYNPRGQLSVKTLARGGTATHTYFDATPTLTGELKKIDYAGAITPDVQYTYNRAGLIYTVNDAIGTRTFTYNAALRLTKEVLPTGFVGNLQINHAYESSGAHRRTALEVGPSTDTDRDLKDVYAYHASTGRLSTIAAHYSGGPKTFTYSYLPGTDLVDSVSSGYYERSTYWQTFRRLEDAVETTWNGSLRASYLYGYDLEGRRLAENVTGPITTKWDAGWTHGFQMSWTYTGRGEIDLTQTRLLDSSGQPTGAWISAWQKDWNWDDVSNRTFENRSGSSDTTYSPDSLNQYDSISGHLAEPGIDYDDDGNLSVDGTWSYTYDLEDRVVTMTRTGVSLTFTYDYLGRRVRKVASGASCGAPGTYEYVYDGFNLLVIYKNDTRFETYTWGLDKTGTLHGAGGVGGLLMMRGGNAVFPVYDARGNVTGYINSSDGVLYRAYQFDAFGNPVAFVLDPGISTRDFVGFASKLTDIDGDPGADAGLVNFGLRLYQPKHGRFIHRDPIGEAGGENLYAHTWNDPVNRWDYLGMQAVDRPPPPDPWFPPIYLPEPPLRDDFPIPNYPGPDVPAPPPWSHWTWADANSSHKDEAQREYPRRGRVWEPLGIGPRDSLAVIELKIAINSGESLGDLLSDPRLKAAFEKAYGVQIVLGPDPDTVRFENLVLAAGTLKDGVRIAILAMGAGVTRPATEGTIRAWEAIPLTDATKLRIILQAAGLISQGVPIGPTLDDQTIYEPAPQKPVPTKVVDPNERHEDLRNND